MNLQLFMAAKLRRYCNLFSERNEIATVNQRIASQSARMEVSAVRLNKINIEKS